MVKYEYNVRSKKELWTKVDDQSKFLEEFFNEIGENGELIIGTPTEEAEPSQFTGPGNKAIPYYKVTVLTAKVIESKPEVKSA